MNDALRWLFAFVLWWGPVILVLWMCRWTVLHIAAKAALWAINLFLWGIGHPEGFRERRVRPPAERKSPFTVDEVVESLTDGISEVPEPWEHNDPDLIEAVRRAREEYRKHGGIPFEPEDRPKWTKPVLQEFMPSHEMYLKLLNRTTLPQGRSVCTRCFGEGIEKHWKYKGNGKIDLQAWPCPCGRPPKPGAALDGVPGQVKPMIRPPTVKDTLQGKALCPGCQGRKIVLVDEPKPDGTGGFATKGLECAVCEGSGRV